MHHVRAQHWSGMPDREWIPRAVKQGFVIVTADRNEQTRGYTSAALIELGARVILLGRFWDNLGAWEKAKWLVNRIEGLVELARAMEGGSVVLLSQAGHPQRR